MTRKPLADSIRRIGLVNLPILTRKGEGGRRDAFGVVAGFRRIKALQSLHVEQFPCRILPDEVSPRECLLLNLYDNLTVRPFNPVETAMALARLVELFPPEEVVKSFMPLFNLPSHAQTLRLFAQIETDFENRAKDLLAGGDLSMKGAKLFAGNGSNCTKAFLPLFFRHQIQPEPNRLNLSISLTI